MIALRVDTPARMRAFLFDVFLLMCVLCPWAWCWCSLYLFFVLFVFDFVLYYSFVIFVCIFLFFTIVRVVVCTRKRGPTIQNVVNIAFS